MSTIRIVVLFGGRSGEHEVSIRSAASVISALDREKYEVVPVGITNEGQWLSPAESARLLPAHSVGSLSTGTAVALPPQPGAATGADVVFPVLHGTFGEDGTIQGLLELADVPYVGCGVLSSAAAMDKDVMKRLFRERGLPTVDHVALPRRERHEHTARLEERFGYPMFVKPANLGSSVGIAKVGHAAELARALDLAAQHDSKIVVEPAIEGREIECAVLGNDKPAASVPGEVIPGGEFYDYQAKYVDDTSKLVIPAALSAEQTSEVQRLAVAAFEAAGCAGLARVDFFLENASGRILLNELNTMPGFTSISMYPKLWAASGVPYSELLDRLVELAFDRHREKSQSRFSLNPEPS